MFEAEILISVFLFFIFQFRPLWERSRWHPYLPMTNYPDAGSTGIACRKREQSLSFLKARIRAAYRLEARLSSDSEAPIQSLWYISFLSEYYAVANMHQVFGKNRVALISLSRCRAKARPQRFCARRSSWRHIRGISYRLYFTISISSGSRPEEQ